WVIGDWRLKIGVVIERLNYRCDCSVVKSSTNHPITNHQISNWEAGQWSGWPDSNRRPLDPQAGESGDDERGSETNSDSYVRTRPSMRQPDRRSLARARTSQ